MKGQSCFSLEQPLDSSLCTCATRVVRFGTAKMLHCILAFQFYKLGLFIGLQRANECKATMVRMCLWVLHEWTYINGLGKRVFPLGQKAINSAVSSLEGCTLAWNGYLFGRT